MRSLAIAIAALCLGSTCALAADKKKIEIITTHAVEFPAGGSIRVDDSFGELRVETWDRPEVEITIKKATRKRYAERDYDQALRTLNSVEVIASREAPDQVVVTTRFPSRNLFTRPLRGKSNVELTYHIKTPANVDLSIEHDIGEVRINGVQGDIRATARIGEISMRLPESERYTVDARTKIGDVESDFGGDYDRKFLQMGAQLRSDKPWSTHRIYARVGIGQINIRKFRASTSPRKEIFAE